MDIKKQYIDGNWITAASGAERSIINPFNQEIISIVTESDETDTQKAINAARTAFDKGDWSTMPAIDRGKIVRKIADLIERDAEELAELETLDTGKTLEESRWDMQDIAEVFRYYADIGDKDAGEVIVSPIPNSISRVFLYPFFPLLFIKLNLLNKYLTNRINPIYHDILKKSKGNNNQFNFVWNKNIWI